LADEADSRGFLFVVLDPRKSAQSASSAVYLICHCEHSLDCTLSFDLRDRSGAQPDEEFNVAGGAAQR
jgi:hypothetical protein